MVLAAGSSHLVKAELLNDPGTVITGGYYVYCRRPPLTGTSRTKSLTPVSAHNNILLSLGDMRKHKLMES